MKNFDGISTAALIQQNGAYLLVKRKPGTSIGESWEFPGGKAEPGESPETALERELDEELSIKAQTGDMVFETQFENKGKVYRLMAFDATITSGDLRLEEHSEYGYFTVTQLAGLDMADSDTQIANFLEYKTKTEINHG